MHSSNHIECSCIRKTVFFLVYHTIIMLVCMRIYMYTSIQETHAMQQLIIQWNLSTTGLQRAARLSTTAFLHGTECLPYSYYVLKPSISGTSLLRPTAMAMKRVPKRSITIALCLQQWSKPHPFVNHTLHQFFT